ncbi:MAG: START domain-containing protein [Hahellaceae bacterium]|nr:START domain-containing protein [Hahellaceae bacterium]
MWLRRWTRQHSLGVWILGLWLVSPVSIGEGGEPLWERVHQEKGISISTRPVEGSSIRAFRAIAIIDANPEAVLALMDDPLVCPLWIYGCRESEILETVDFYHRSTYQINDMPWPAEDRDLAMDVAISERADGTFELVLTNAPDRVPVTKYVRVPVAEGLYRLKQLAPGRTRLEWTQHMEPGGYLPDWLVNQLLLDIPLVSLRQLRELLADPRSPYRQRKLARDADGRVIGWAR